MGEKLKTATKISETKSANAVSRKPEVVSPQSVNSPVDQILSLQRTIGNQAVQKLFQSGALQAKLKIGQPNDRYEQEADRVADQVMRMPELPRQRQPEEEEEGVQPKPLTAQITPLVQRQPEEEEEEELLQTKELSGQTREVNTDVETNVNVVPSGGRPLPESVRDYFEPRFGYDFDQVRVHTGSCAAEAAKAVHARAFTFGHNIAFGARQYAPETTTGRQLLAHELTHVIQQQGSTIKRNSSIELNQSEMPSIQHNYADGNCSISWLQSPQMIHGPKKLTKVNAVQSGSLIQRAYQLTTTGVTRYKTASGNFYRFPPQTHHTNRTNRPRFIHPRSVMVPYTGTGAAGGALIHPAVTTALNALMSALRAEGLRIDDESLKQADIGSAYRPSTLREGQLYLAALQRTIRRNPTIFGSLTFPSSIEAMAQSELGTTGSPRHRAFVTALARQSGWNRSLAQRLVDITRRYKAPRGGSTHHSGLVVDIDFPYATSTTSVQRHGMNRSRNLNAFHAAAGVWLNTYSRSLGFDTYDTNREIWHQEWLNWADTAADPATIAAPSTSGGTAPAPVSGTAPGASGGTAPRPTSGTHSAPPPTATPCTHTVVSGDTLSELATRYRTTVDAIRRANGLTSDRINIGQVLTIPGGTTPASAPAPAATPSPPAVSSGPSCALTRFNGSNFTGSPVTADVQFVDELNLINNYAGARSVQLYITNSFRETGSTISGAIVTPATYSNHLAGHAIDMNIRQGGRLYNSRALRRANLPSLPAEVRGFINDIRGDRRLRWGGDFSPQDPVHIDDHLNANITAWRARYQATQRARRSKCG